MRHRLSLQRCEIQRPSSSGLLSLLQAFAVAGSCGCGESGPAPGSDAAGEGVGAPSATAGMGASLGGASAGNPVTPAGASGGSGGTGDEVMATGIGRVGVEADSGTSGVPAEPTPNTPRVVSWETRTLSTLHTAEGADAGDIDGDGVIDLVAGPTWYKGPEFDVGGTLLPSPPSFSRDQYSTFFLTFVDDIDGDGNLDVLAIGDAEAQTVRATPTPSGTGTRVPTLSTRPGRARRSTRVSSPTNRRPSLTCPATRDGS